jgi:hypothetical protein
VIKLIDLEKLGITEKVLIENGFSVGTAYNILKGKISKKSLIKLYDLGIIKKIDSEDKFYCSNNNLFGEYNCNIVKKELVVIEDKYKVRLVMKVLNYDLLYLIDIEDLLVLEEKGINILERENIVVKIVGSKLNFIK